MNAIDFLKLFNHKKYTLAHTSKTSMRSFPCRSDKLQDGLDYLHTMNKKGCEVYFMVNEGTGEWNDPEKKTACHSSKNVIGLSAIFLDAELPNDEDPLENIHAFCEKFFVYPNIVVQSSEHRYHCYWLLEPEELSKRSIIQWKQIQALLHSKLSIDRTMTDIPQILRIPEFKNVKRNFEIKTLKDKINGEPYKLNYLYEILKVNFPELTEQRTFEPLKTVTEDYKVPEGERHEEILRRARKMYSIPSITDEEIKCFIDGFIHNHVEENKDFIPGGKRRLEIDRILQAAKTYAEEEKQKQITQNLETLQKNKKSKSPFELDPDFFYQAPGLVGEITRYIVDSTQYPIPAHAFAAATSLVGITKARYIHGARNLPPLNYFLCLAPSAGGKTSIQDLIKELFSKLGLKHLIDHGVTSAPGIIKFLSDAKGIGLVLCDEVKDLFQVISSNRAATYEIRINSELTKLYTAYNSYYSPPTTKTDKNKITLEKPLFSFLGFGHFNLVESLFTKDNVQEGLIPRFIVLNVENRTSTTQFKKLPSSSLIDQLRYHVTKSNLILEQKIENAPSNSPVSEIENKIDRIELLHTEQSEIIFKKFEQKANQYYDQAVLEKTGLEALFSRGCEQVLRLSLAIENGPQFTAKTLEFSTTLVDNQMQEFYGKFDKVINQTKFTKDTDKLFDKIAELIQDNNNKPILKRDLQRATQRWYKPGEFKQRYDELKEHEKIIESTMQMPSGQKKITIAIGDL